MIHRSFRLFLGPLAAFAFLLAPLEKHSTLWVQALQDAAHGPLFAFVAASILHGVRSASPKWPIASQYLFSFVVALLVGSAGELAQALFTTTRSAEWNDVAMDGIGAVIGLGLMGCLEPASRISLRVKIGATLPATLLAGSALALPLVQVGLAYWQRQHQLPDLITWPRGMYFAQGTGADLSLVSAVTSSSSQSALVVTPSPHAMWPGITIQEPWPDWSSYRALEIAVLNPSSADLTLNVRINDKDHNGDYADRFNYSFLAPARQSITLLLRIQEIQQGPAKRELDLRNIAQLVLFEENFPATKPFVLQRLRLVN